MPPPALTLVGLVKVVQVQPRPVGHLHSGPVPNRPKCSVTRPCVKAGVVSPVEATDTVAIVLTAKRARDQRHDARSKTCRRHLRSPREQGRPRPVHITSAPNRESRVTRSDWPGAHHPLPKYGRMDTSQSAFNENEDRDVLPDDSRESLWVNQISINTKDVAVKNIVQPRKGETIDL